MAPQGTALTADHGRILKRYANEVVLCFDSDNAGQKAAVKALDVLAPAELGIRVLHLPAPHDPDSYIREFGAETFQQAVQDAPEYFTFLFDRLSHEHDPTSDRGRRTILHEMHAGLTVANDAVLRDTWLRRIAARLGVSTEAVTTEFGRLDRQRRTPGPAPSRDHEFGSVADPLPIDADLEPKEPENIPQREEWLLRIFFQLTADDPDAVRDTHVEWLDSPTIRHIITVHLEALKDGSWTGKAALFDRFEDSFERGLIAKTIAEQRPIPRIAEQYRQILNHLRDTYLLRTLPIRFNHPATPEDERARLLGEWLALKKRGPSKESAAGY